MGRRQLATNRLSNTEAMVMNVIWENEHNPLPTHQLIAAFNKKFCKNYARTTMVTFLARTEEKGYTTHTRIGRNVYWTPIKSKDEYIQDLFNNMVDLWLDHDITKLDTLIESYKNRK